MVWHSFIKYGPIYMYFVVESPQLIEEFRVFFLHLRNVNGLLHIKRQPMILLVLPRSLFWRFFAILIAQLLFSDDVKSSDTFAVFIIVRL